MLMLAAGFLVAAMDGRLEEVTKAAVSSAGDAVELCIGLLGVMCLWTGLMGIAEKSGLVSNISKAAKPVLSFLFPSIPKNHPALGAVMMNMVANFLGLGNAATPLGLKAMGEMQKINPRKRVASDAMSMFLVLNTSAVQLIPATIIAVRSAAGSGNPTEIIGTIWVASLCAATAGIIAAKFFSLLVYKRGKHGNY